LCQSCRFVRHTYARLRNLTRQLGAGQRLMLRI
jgi:hypothetical protein